MDPIMKRFSWIATAFLLPVVAGCDRLLDVEVPSRVEASSLYIPANAELLVNSAVGDFECALASYIVATGLMTDELVDAALQVSRWDYDARRTLPSGESGVDPCTDLGVYTPLSTARWQADEIREALEGWSDAEVPSRDELIATAAAHAGYSLVLMGEVMCSAAIDEGPELSKADLFRLAEERFTTALAAAQAANDADLIAFARVGRARALLDRGEEAAAAADATLVPADFVRNATYSAAAPRRENLIFRDNILASASSIDPAYRNLTYGGVADPRVPTVNTGELGADGITPLWHQRKYTDRGSPIPIATWDEAQLIVAEVAGGQQAVDIINQLHQRANLPPFSSSDPAAIRQQVIEERRRELFLEGHHLYDVVRYGLPLVPAPGTPYPPKAGGFYGDQTCLPLPDVERRNNPNLAARSGGS